MQIRFPDDPFCAQKTGGMSPAMPKKQARKEKEYFLLRQLWFLEFQKAVAFQLVGGFSQGVAGFGRGIAEQLAAIVR